jgi:hypothetical protein
MGAFLVLSVTDRDAETAIIWMDLVLYTVLPVFLMYFEALGARTFGAELTLCHFEMTTFTQVRFVSSPSSHIYLYIWYHLIILLRCV